MALLMVHLLTAQRWAQAHGEYRDCPEFYLGAISPDAMHIRTGGDKSRKNEFHLYNWTSPNADEVLRYWRDHHTPFDIGYGIHVLTDAQWVPGYRACFPGLLLPNGFLDVKTYYNDTYVSDFELYRDGGSDLLELAMKAVPPEDHPLLTAYEFDQWRIQTQEIYLGECPGKEPVRYITREYINEFISAAQNFLEQVYRAHERGEETWRF